MGTLFGTLGLAQRSLQTQQYGLEIAQRNISNSETPGYTRQRLNLVPGDPAGLGFAGAGGVLASSIDSFRDRFIDGRVSQEEQAKGEFDALLGALDQVQALVDENAGQGLQGALSSFFNSLEALTAAPEDFTLRQDVLTRAERLAEQFRALYGDLQSVRAAQDAAVAATVDDINGLTAVIARLNSQVQARTASRDGQALLAWDERQAAIDRLSALVDIQVVEDASGAVTITTGNGALLVAGGSSHALSAATSLSGGLLEVHDATGADITGSISSGELGGQLQARDVHLPNYLRVLDDLAAGLAARINGVHAGGVDYDGNAGGDFFVPFVPATPGDNTGAARNLAVALTDPRRIAAAGAGGGPGDNANARLLAAVQDERLFAAGSLTATEFYAGLVASVGRDAKSAQDSADTSRFLLTQLRNQRDAVAGVSLDEEAINVIRFQKAFQASARLIQVLDGLTEDVLRLIGG